MNNLEMIYLGMAPYYLLILASFFGLKSTPVINLFLFLYSSNVLNWICGYHWTLAANSFQSQTRVACGIIMCVSLWAVYTYIDGQHNIAKYLMSALWVFQLYGDFRSDVTYTISPHIKLARIILSSCAVYSLLRLM